ncbi:hypothetical protein [Candidatus Bodocaedibacter vickermanii]|uniref:Tetratricopeptide repeat-containing protein n=1 Tax=Candidatus Bodocaedibacter vickermanii TaxID=2741701 RepID=A0A7L9RVP0_9PROT|nr:hypothetical protein CPBP_01212 [Candidatus Paracaedibacteraceae bacterium 'Lake Konstanz']
MTQAFKSLFITSILTLPSVFAADELSVLTLPAIFPADELRVSAAVTDAIPRVTPAEVQRQAGQLRGWGQSESAAILFERSTTLSEVTPRDIRYAAIGMYDLGDGFYDRAAVLYEQSAGHSDATSKDRNLAIDGIRAIAAKCREGSAERARYNALADAIAAK